jgi:hypothetical protein
LLSSGNAKGGSPASAGDLGFFGNPRSVRSPPRSLRLLGHHLAEPALGLLDGAAPSPATARPALRRGIGGDQGFEDVDAIAIGQRSDELV